MVLTSISNRYYYDYSMTRETKQKEAVYRAVKENNIHPTADWIYEQVRREIPRISLGTVYRNLNMLKQEGKILELNFAGSQSRFDGNTQNHYHIGCELCGAIRDVDEPVNLETEARVAQKTGFQVFSHRMDFRGLCQDCQTRLASGHVIMNGNFRNLINGHGV